MTPAEQFREENIARSPAENVEITIEQARLLLAAGGMCGEAGEVFDSLKKHVWHGKPFDREHAIEEVGDVLWYADRYLWLLGATMDECMAANTAKLRARYPDGFKKKEPEPDPIYPYSAPEAAMVFLNGSKQSFRCHCGCNVFTTRPNSQYVCNACEELYQGS